MNYKIADLQLQLDPVGNVPERMTAYEASIGSPDFVIAESELNLAHWKSADLTTAYYMETGWRFYYHLLDFGGMMLHSSAVVVDGLAYLFSGPPGMGKSTHTQLYRRLFGDRAVIINDDKPALRRIGGIWYAYGTPWCGKDGINVNAKAPVAGICLLKRGDTELVRMKPVETLPYILSQTQHKLDAEKARKLVAIVDSLVREVPVFMLHSHAQPDDARLTYTELTKACREMQK